MARKVIKFISLNEYTYGCIIVMVKILNNRLNIRGDEVILKKVRFTQRILTARYKNKKEVQKFAAFLSLHGY